jgi:hypothetical protein
MRFTLDVGQPQQGSLARLELGEYLRDGCVLLKMRLR